MNRNQLLNFFIPHHLTHQKSHLISWHYLVIYLLLFMLLRVSFDLINIFQPNVLGVSSQISVDRIIEETNKERAKKGLSQLKQNQFLNTAAENKAKNMLEENYWAHFAPSGKDPWSFINTSGYKFSYAGENLARNFYNSEDVVRAWMNSPSHRDNLLNKNYHDIGIAVIEGTLLGQKTTLVVQMFGSPYQAIAVSPQTEKEALARESEAVRGKQFVPIQTKRSLEDISYKFYLDPIQISKVFGIMIISLIIIVMMADFVFLRRRGVIRLSSHHIAHLGFLALTGAALASGTSGDILEGISILK